MLAETENENTRESTLKRDTTARKGKHGGRPSSPTTCCTPAPLEPITGDFTGGTYFLCGEEGGRRPVVFASSDGEGGLIAADLPDALEIILGLQWRDCLGFSDGGDVEVMLASAQHLERYLAMDNPEIAEERARVDAALSL
jgi:hypothetical protein